MPVSGRDTHQPQGSSAYSGRQYGEARISGRSIVHQGDVNIYNQHYSPHDGFAERQDCMLNSTRCNGMLTKG